MVELVDTQDLKSCSRKRSAGSIPALSTTQCKSALGFLLFEGSAIFRHMLPAKMVFTYQNFVRRALMNCDRSRSKMQPSPIF
jgi:hypothetical protein